MGETYKKHNKRPPYATIISAKRTLCINPEVNEFESRYKIDAECKKRTTFKIKPPCQFYSNFKNNFLNTNVEKKVYNIEDLIE